jgi:hypothetical protein
MNASLTTSVYQNFNGLQHEECIHDDQLVDYLQSGRSSVSRKLEILHN